MKPSGGVRWQTDDNVVKPLQDRNRGAAWVFLLTVAGWSNNPRAGTTVLLGSAGTWKSSVQKRSRRTKGEQKWRGRTKGGEECDSPTLNSLQREVKITYTYTHRRSNPWATWTYLICLSFSRGINFYFLIYSVSLNQISSVHFSLCGPSQQISCLAVWQPESTYSYLCSLIWIRPKPLQDTSKHSGGSGPGGMVKDDL